MVAVLDLQHGLLRRDRALNRHAEISRCGRYRYALYRDWDIGRKVTFVMLNPSTADASIDDPTIRRCINFAKDWGYSGLCVVNVLAYRATKPRDLPPIGEAMGPINYQWITWGCTHGELIVPAWGVRHRRYRAAYGAACDAMIRVRDRHGTPIEVLGYTQGFDPRHPLYMRADTQRIPYIPDVHRG